MTEGPILEIARWVATLVGLPCWHVDTRTGRSFALHLGEKRLREKPMSNPSLGPLRRYDSSHRVVVWTSDWILDGAAGPADLTHTVVDGAGVQPSGTLVIRFDSGAMLQVPVRPREYTANWELSIDDEGVAIDQRGVPVRWKSGTAR